MYWTDDYWRHHFEDCFGTEYTPPSVPQYGSQKVLGLYDEDSIASCGDQPYEDDRNAYYCGLDDTMAWGQSYMNVAKTAGDGWVYLVVAHEWGSRHPTPHPTQIRIGT